MSENNQSIIDATLPKPAAQPQRASEIIVVQDVSGSMLELAKDTVGSYNAFLAEQKGIPGVCNWTLCLFNTSNEFICDGLNINDVAPLTESGYRPRGGTALYDAIGAAADRAEKRGVTKALMVINTDGEENSSREYRTPDKVKALIDRLTQNGWEFLYLGANQDSMLSAGGIGIPVAATCDWHATSEGMKGSYVRTSSITRRYRASQ